MHNSMHWKWRSFVAGSQLEPFGLFKRACQGLGGSSFSVLHRSSTKRWKQGGTSNWWNVNWYVACILFAFCCSTSFLKHRFFVLWILCIGISLHLCLHVLLFYKGYTSYETPICLMISFWTFAIANVVVKGILRDSKRPPWDEYDWW